MGHSAILRFSAAKVKSNIKMLAENRVEPHPAAKPRNIQLPRLEKSMAVKGGTGFRATACTA